MSKKRSEEKTGNTQQDWEIFDVLCGADEVKLSSHDLFDNYNKDSSIFI